MRRELVSGERTRHPKRPAVPAQTYSEIDVSSPTSARKATSAVADRRWRYDSNCASPSGRAVGQSVIAIGLRLRARGEVRDGEDGSPIAGVLPRDFAGVSSSVA